MKKLLALLLAVVMVLGVAVTAFAVSKDFKATGIDPEMWDIIEEEVTGTHMEWQWDDGEEVEFITLPNGFQIPVGRPGHQMVLIEVEDVETYDLIDGTKVAGPPFAKDADGKEFLVAGETYKWTMEFPALIGRDVTKSSGRKALFKALKKDLKNKNIELEDGATYEVTVDGVTFETTYFELADNDEQIFTVVDIDYAEAFAKGGIVLEATIEDGADFIDKFEFSKYLDELRLTLGVKKAYYTGTKTTAYSLAACLDVDKDVKVEGLYKNVKVGATVGAAGDVADTTKIYAIAKAADGDEYDIEWGDYAMFTVVVKESEDNRNIAFTTAPDDAVLDAFPNVAMDFYTWPANPRFDNLGTVTLYSDLGKYLYAIVDGKLAEVEFEKDDDEFTFKTRTLGSYILSAEKLDIEAYNKLVAKEEKESDNPYTGR